MKKLLIYAVLSLLAIAPVHAQTGVWRDINGRPSADSESRKSKNDFAGWLLATTDQDWKEKWDTPAETAPNFTMATTVPYGKKVFILMFFVNPKLDSKGSANVRCDLQITEPTGKVALTEKDLTCYSGPIKGEPYNLYLSAPVIAIAGDPGDPPGSWVVNVNLRDAVRDTVLPLRTTFELH